MNRTLSMHSWTFTCVLGKRTNIKQEKETLCWMTTSAIKKVKKVQLFPQALTVIASLHQVPFLL